MASFTDLLLQHYHDLTISQTTIDGHSLTVADVVMVARHLLPSSLVPESAGIVSEGDRIVREKLAKGDVIYGTNTGFGGSADMRTAAYRGLQQSLFSHLMFGILAEDKPSFTNKAKKPIESHSLAKNNGVVGIAGSTLSLHCTPKVLLPINESVGTTMPESWVRAAMLVRLNSLSRGASGIRPCVAESLVTLLNKDIVPRIPTRGSISASGDLSPLSYIGAAMQGKQSVTVFTGPHTKGSRMVVRADAALVSAGITPIDIQAKEGLAIVNGTAFSAGIASLAVHECLCLAGLAQVLTAMSVEALLGTEESFDPFIAQVRPHPGQVDSAKNIYAFLRDSRLTVATNNPLKSKAGELCQDRYSIRTASQWIGPVLEDFALAYQQLSTEINSVTDNPLVDVPGNRILSGGNFQARAVTSAVEKLRQGLQSLGRMIFTQAAELVNPATSRGLPPNLASDDPSSSYLFKGIDVMTAALTSELGFLANPVGSHVQTAEMGNQAINSLALISTRYTLESVDVFSQLAAAHLVMVCQALDLRALECEFRKALAPEFSKNLRECMTYSEDEVDSRAEALWTRFLRSWETYSNMDLDQRLSESIHDLEGDIIKGSTRMSLPDTLIALSNFRRTTLKTARETYMAMRARFNDAGGLNAGAYLGLASKRLYQFVRHDLGVPFIGEELLQGVDNIPSAGFYVAMGEMGAQVTVAPSLGTYLTAVYEAIRSGGLYEVVIDCLKDARMTVGQQNGNA
ncbi:phenylalanine ammonia-lyase [Xylaria sp. FL0933]|nr:phenylalanine ammonia-lyase [Xylaria sp. FL0933]